MNPWVIAVPTVAASVAAFTAYGAVHAHSQLFGPTIRRTDRASRLAITFDDGPNPAITPKLLALLARYEAKATFFLVGKFVRECPQLVKEIAARGHLLGNHTETHPNLLFCGPTETREELLRCNEAIAHATWEEPQWFRPPFGYRSPWLGLIAEQHGMRVVMWTLLPGDWRAKPADWLIRRIKPIAAAFDQKESMGMSKSGTGTGDILCLHDGNYRQQNGDRVRTLAALEYWLPRWRDLGLEFVTISGGTGASFT
jgi:peptidoglycan-N-acetylglucosamine deacetylase